MDKRELIEQLQDDFVMVIGSGLVGYHNFMVESPMQSYVPPGKEEIISMYRNNALFYRTVNSIVHYLLERVDSVVEEYLNSANHSANLDAKSTINSQSTHVDAHQKPHCEPRRDSSG